MKNTERFGNKADAYSAARPAYATEFIDALYTEHGFYRSSAIADVGSGTGILTKQLLERGSRVYAVEPNDSMRAKAEDALKPFDNFISVCGTAENTTLPDNSVNFITTAQAFHWFDVKAFKAECDRILKPNGKIFLIWNSRIADAKVNLAQYAVCEKYCPSFTGFNGGTRNDESKIREFFGGKYSYTEYDNPLFYDRQKFIQRGLSSSYSLNKTDKHYDEYLQELNDVFDKYASNGIITVPNKTEVYFN